MTVTVIVTAVLRIILMIESKKKKHKKNCSFKINKKNQVLVYFEFPTESAVFATILQ